MNKAHRDRIAFMRICSGRFDREKEYLHVQGGKLLRLPQPQQLMASDRAVIDVAYAGDIIGVFDPGIFSIGDTVCEKDADIRYEGIPSFAPEHFASVERIDTMKRKQFEKGILQIAQEGAIQIFHEPHTGVEEVIVAEAKRRLGELKVKGLLRRYLAYCVAAYCIDVRHTVCEHSPVIKVYGGVVKFKTAHHNGHFAALEGPVIADIPPEPEMVRGVKGDIGVVKRLCKALAPEK